MFTGLLLTASLRSVDISNKSAINDYMDLGRWYLSRLYLPIFLSDVFNLVSMARSRTFASDNISHVTKFLPLTMTTLMSPVGTVLQESLRFAVNGLFELFGFLMGFEDYFFKMLTSLMGLYWTTCKMHTTNYFCTILYMWRIN